MGESNKKSEKALFKVFAFLLGAAVVGFAGGLLSYPLLDMVGCHYQKISDPVSIANTFIVFTTIIFVGFSVVLVIIGFIFTEHLSTTKETHLQSLANEFPEMFKKDPNLALELVKKILADDHVMDHIDDILNSKVSEIIADRSAAGDEEASDISAKIDKG
jgi:predicted PurR-regulated permease PerM